MDSLLNLLTHEPIGAFAILLAVILIVPPLFERLRLPGVLGLLAAGVLLGPNSLQLLSSTSPVMALLADVGLIYLMFVAGLEIDLRQLNQVKGRALGFGGLTFTLPLLTGTLIGFAFGFGWNGAFLLGSLLASHSLMTYPVVRRLGVVTNEAVTVTIGATICTDIAALIVLAICLGIHEGGFSVVKLLTLLLLLSLYTIIVLFGFDRAGRAFFQRTGGNEGEQFLFVLLAVFLAALGAQLIGVEKIVGAFLSGLAVNDVVGNGPVKEKVVFVGSVLFIPIFFVNIGLLINLPAFLRSLTSLGLMVAIVSGLLASKFLAALLAKLSFRYSWREMLTMWSISIPQVATTLAATLVGNRAGILSDEVLNSVVVMMLVTATAGPLIVSRVAVGLPLPTPPQPRAVPWLNPQAESTQGPLTVVVPVYNPQTEQSLIEMAALLAAPQSGRIIPLAITLARPHMESRHFERAMAHSEALLAQAQSYGDAFPVTVTPLLRIDEQVPLGICRAALEQRANLILLGWGQVSGLRARLFGNIVDTVFWAAPCPVAVARLLQSPQQFQRILVPVENFTDRVVRIVSFARLLADTTQAAVTLLHILNYPLLDQPPDWAETQLKDLIVKAQFQTPVQTLLTQGGDIADVILQESATFDLVILHSQRHQTAAEGFGFSSITSQIVQQLTCSTIVLGENHLLI